MEAFVWDQHFTTGLERVDRQHHHLVDLINQLGTSLIAVEAEDPGSLQAIFGELADYARYHFAEEERLMAEAGIAARHGDGHRRSHADFIEQVETMWNSRNSMANAADTLHAFLRSWLAFHILGEDQAMARQLALIRDGKSPDEACEIDSVPKDNATAALLTALNNLYHVLSGQNRDLAAANVGLEQRVAARTRELAQANQNLTELNQRLEAISNSDGLLGIPNRRYFDARLDAEWRRAGREHQPLSLLMIDVDYFKRYNDRYGHQAGDNCLQGVARAISSALKRPGDVPARYGGEELAVILANTELDGAVTVARTIQRQLGELHIPQADSAVTDEVTISIGAATMMPGQQTSATMLVAAADRGLYSAKDSGRNRVCAGT